MGPMLPILFQWQLSPAASESLLLEKEQIDDAELFIYALAEPILSHAVRLVHADSS